MGAVPGSSACGPRHLCICSCKTRILRTHGKVDVMFGVPSAHVHMKDVCTTDNDRMYAEKDRNNEIYSICSTTCEA